MLKLVRSSGGWSSDGQTVKTGEPVFMSGGVVVRPNDHQIVVKRGDGSRSVVNAVKDGVYTIRDNGFIVVPPGDNEVELRGMAKVVLARHDSIAVPEWVREGLSRTGDGWAVLCKLYRGGHSYTALLSSRGGPTAKESRAAQALQAVSDLEGSIPSGDTPVWERPVNTGLGDALRGVH